MNNFKVLMNGIVKENPTFVLLLGMCPTLGTTSSAINGMGMGLATAFVLICSNVVISAIKNLIPDMVRIPAFVVVIASFVTLLQMIMQAYVPALYATLGLFIPLIVVNCIILGRAESYASKNPVLPSIFDELKKRKPDHFAVRQYAKFKLSAGKTAKSILISCGARLAPFDIPQLREIMSYDELELDRMGDRRTATFFCISDTDSTYNFLVALAFSQMFNLLCERADNVHGGRLPYHVRVLWDEAANTGQVPTLEKLVAVIRSREISLCLLYQQLAQCKAIYDKNTETILGNMDSVLFLGGREASTIKEISENWLGKATISMQTEGRSRGQSESYNQNTQRLGRELMTPSELATMPGDKCILQLRGLPPFFSSKYDLKQHPNYKYTSDYDPKNALDIEKFLNRKEKIHPDDEFIIVDADSLPPA